MDIDYSTNDCATCHGRLHHGGGAEGAVEPLPLGNRPFVFVLLLLSPFLGALPPLPSFIAGISVRDTY